MLLNLQGVLIKCFPQEEVVMALTSKTDVKSDCLPLNSSKLKYHIPHTCIDHYLMKRRLLVIYIF